MGDLGGFLGSMFGAALGPIGLIGIHVGSEIENKNKKQPEAPSNPHPEPVDYSDALKYASDDNKTTALAQIQSQEFQIHQATLDREMQQAASLELAFEKFDTKLQTAKLDYFQGMASEENRHVEALATYQHKFRSQEVQGDLPPPETES